MPIIAARTIVALFLLALFLLAVPASFNGLKPTAPEAMSWFALACAWGFYAFLAWCLHVGGFWA